MQWTTTPHLPGHSTIHQSPTYLADGTQPRGSEKEKASWADPGVLNVFVIDLHDIPATSNKPQLQSISTYMLTPITPRQPAIAYYPEVFHWVGRLEAVVCPGYHTHAGTAFALPEHPIDSFSS